MGFPSSRSFTALANLHLPSSHVLHPDACNPAMDLVVLLGQTEESASTAAVSHLRQNGHSSKGKGKAEAAGYTTKIALWRMSGSRAWEVEVEGRVAGLAWSPDGIHLSLLVFRYPSLLSTFLDASENWRANSATLEHLSVHNGSVVRSLPCPQLLDNVQAKDWKDLKDGRRWWRMEWKSGGMEWEKPKNGSVGMIIDLLPRVTPVEPPRPAHALPFSLSNAASTSPSASSSLHPKLHDFPSLLPSTPQTSPDILCSSPPSGLSTHRFLTGTFPLPSSTKPPSSPVLSLAQISDRMSGFLEAILRSLEAAEHAFRDGEKQTLIWREDLETCADQQGMSKEDVHADLFKFLMTGRSGVAVTEWLGNRLTGRTIAKWELALENTFKTIQRTISQSLTPAVERLILLLEELRGWAKTRSCSQQLALNGAAIKRAVDMACGFAALVERMRQDAEHEMQAAAEWMKWLKYGIAKAAAQDPSQDSLPTAMYDLKLVWSFMQNGFVASPFQRYFPRLPHASHDDLLPEAVDPYSAQSVRNLEDVLDETMSKLSAQSGEQHPPLSQKTEDDASPNQEEVSIDSSIFALPSTTDETPTKAFSPDGPSSPDTVEMKRPDNEVIERHIQEEPLVWAKSLLVHCEGIVKHAIAGGADAIVTPLPRLHPDGESLYAERIAGQGRWIAYLPTLDLKSQPLRLCLLHFPSDQSSRGTAVALGLGDEADQVRCFALQFFDDDELVLVLENAEKRRYLATIDYQSLRKDMVDLRFSTDFPIADLTNGIVQHPPFPITISRCRPLNISPPSSHRNEIKEKVTLALNGRKGRRVGCIMMGEGREVEVLDMDQDEDADDGNNEDDESGMEGVEDG